MYRIGKKFTFDAAHAVPAAADERHCPPGLHGHTYTIGVVLAAEQLEQPGFVIDFAALNPFARHLNEVLDHQLLNDVLDQPPTHQALNGYLRRWLETFLVAPTGRVTLDAVSIQAPTPQPGQGPLAECEVTFEAAHRLPGLPIGHKCARVHGHSYRAALGFDGTSRLPDACLAALNGYISTAFNGCYLNDSVPHAGPPTSENLARHLYEWACKELSLPDGTTITAARVSETASTWAEYQETTW